MGTEGTQHADSGHAVRRVRATAAQTDIWRGLEVGRRISSPRYNDRSDVHDRSAGVAHVLRGRPLLDQPGNLPSLRAGNSFASQACQGTPIPEWQWAPRSNVRRPRVTATLQSSTASMGR